MTGIQRNLLVFAKILKSSIRRSRELKTFFFQFVEKIYKEFFMKTKYLYIAQFLAWAGFTFVDFIGRKTSIDNYFKKMISINLKEALCFGIPIILAVFYFIGKIHYGISKRQPLKKQLKRLARLIGIWLLITIISTIVISALVCNDV